MAVMQNLEEAIALRNTIRHVLFSALIHYVRSMHRYIIYVIIWLTVKWRLDFATRCTTGCTTGCIYVYFMQPVVQPIVQSVVQPMQISQSPVNHLLRHAYMT
jgi:hypothetical protein